ncbi:MAG: helix-hairpin-helix domain-containing protein [Thermoplasmata archaeon]
MRQSLGVIAILLSLLVLPISGLGTHDPDHSYYVSGRLTHENGSPACGVAIRAGPDRDGNSPSGFTDHEGRYRIELHFHGPNAPPPNDEGATFQVQVPGTGVTRSSTVTAGPADDAWGESRVDLVVPAGTGGECVAPTNPLALAALYVGIPTAALVGFSIAYVKVVRPWWNRRATTSTLASIPGIGKGRLPELRAMGIRTPEELARAQPAEVARETSIGKKEARRLIRRAREMQGKETGD